MKHLESYKIFEAKKSNKEEFIKKAREIHGDKYDYSKVDYKSGDIKVNIICPEHGIFNQSPYSHLSGSGCPKCGRERIKNFFLGDIKNFIDGAKKIHGDKYDYSKGVYKGSLNKLEIGCPIHGSFHQSPNSHLSGSGCPKCSKEAKERGLVPGYRRKYSSDDFISKAKEIHGDKYDYSNIDYKGIDNYIDIICHKHGSFSQTGSSHLYGKAGCPICRESNGEKNVAKTLDELGIEYRRNYTFKDCKGLKNKLPFDFYIPSLNLCIEYDGLQHYQPVNRFGGEERLKYQQQCDDIKTNYCKDKGIKLLRITYKVKGYQNIFNHVKDYLDSIK
jgi:hypothetical protein